MRVAGFDGVASLETTAADHQKYRPQQLQQGREAHTTGTQQES